MATQKRAVSNEEKQDIEVCAGCGAEAPDGRFEFGGVGAPDPTEGTTPEGEDGPSPSDFVWHPVCNECHRDPAHRTLNKLKVHFFNRTQRRMALLAAQQQVMNDDGR